MTPMPNLRLRVLAFLCAAGAAAAAAPARAADDKPIYSAIMEVVGVNTDPDVKSIDYGERSKLVLPPNSGALPEPRARAAQRPSGWPAERAGAPRRTDAARAPVGAVGPNEPSRDRLTDPPAGYRHATVDLSKIREPEAKSDGINPLGFLKEQAGKVFGGGN
jgi:hypothetical protein